MPRVLGEHIMLREYQAEDIGSIRSWVNDAETTRFLSTRFWPAQTMVDSEEFLQHMLQSSHNAYNFVIASIEDGRYLGQLDMFRLDWRLRCGELGMVIASADDRGRGVGTEALQLMQRFGFLTAGMERIELEVEMGNAAALRCYQKAGFMLEGVKRHAYYRDGQFTDIGIMSVLSDEWRQRNGAASSDTKVSV
ncbi:MAG: GNAT family protein [Eubacteriales bacterium]|nr:GNAT family protein [Eubacteriales bacterium]